MRCKVETKKGERGGREFVVVWRSACEVELIKVGHPMGPEIDLGLLDCWFVFLCVCAWEVQVKRERRQKQKATHERERQESTHEEEPSKKLVKRTQTHRDTHRRQRKTTCGHFLLCFFFFAV